MTKCQVCDRDFELPILLHRRHHVYRLCFDCLVSISIPLPLTGELHSGWIHLWQRLGMDCSKLVRRQFAQAVGPDAGSDKVKVYRKVV